MVRAPGSAPPPSERGSRDDDERRGVGVFRFAGWGWGVTIALALLVAVVVLIGYLRDDPGRNPAPTAYRTAVCAAASELAAGTMALADGVDAADPDAAAATVERRVAAALEAVAELPEWIPGRALDELLGRQVITLTNGAQALRDGDARAEEDLRIARGTDAEIVEQLDGRYGFGC